ncbi:uncharacterized protein Z518_04744 [Rhinocladiella mackenziei CBS 650.93]|uniref:AMP-dependent synthetase/ligase domain-containing protein n=1 Tax=Rhinocladiella mackenziei CBS 650.93 TaxID=1442369 RepID=A0A0D2H8H7_9EURO|nr:uncharacterized protein Z518_04744 [Rhinocladiella mackenziei CBS 650.93]KIX06768.1 hypothetical protein Z518_04744 [Rhinocladiella mackenziei CBS 650.93]
MAPTPISTPLPGFRTALDDFQDYVNDTYGLQIDESIPIDQFPSFFKDARLNFAENMLRGDDDQVSAINMDETNLWNPQKYTWKDLRQLVATYASALRSSALAKGYVVALVGSNCVRSLALLLATAAVGGIFTSLATDIGEKVKTARREKLDIYADNRSKALND